MADDIDIEEHDILEDPRIQHVVNGVTIKKEVEDMEIDEIDDYESLHWEEDDSDPNTSDRLNYFGNRIVLGSKETTTPVFDYAKENLDTIVLIDDWKHRLDTSNFCKQCNILFPTLNALDAHKMAVHSLLVEAPSRNVARKSTSFRNVAVKSTSRNRAVKSTAKLTDTYKSDASEFSDEQSSNSADVEKHKKKHSSKLCNHCNKYFHNETELIKHLYALLPLGEENKKSAVFWKCDICYSYYSSPSNLKKHLIIHHDEHKYPVKRGRFQSKCAFCEYKSSDKLVLNCHIRQRHPEYYNKRKSMTDPDKVKIDKFQCLVCDTCCLSYKGIYAHRNRHHPNKKVNYMKKISVIMDVTDVSKLRVNAALKLVMNHLNKSPKGEIFIPKSAVYKCPNCSVAFVSCSEATQHASLCKGLAENAVKCQQCNNLIFEEDRAKHHYQHSLSDKIHVYLVKNNLQTKLLCQCPSCLSYFHERNFFDHITDCTGKQKTSKCRFCDLAIGAKSLNSHYNKHKVKNFSSKDFVTVSYTPFIDTPKTTLKRKIDDNSGVGAKKPKVNEKKIHFLVCSYCQCCFLDGRDRSIANHSSVCKTTRMLFCKKCGVKITKSMKSSHDTLHLHLKNLSAKNIRFSTLQNRRPIHYIPKYPMCKRCSVCSITTYKHQCDNARVFKCTICKINFDSQTFKLHSQFHENKKPHVKKVKPDLDLLKNYVLLETTWNRLFSCNDCEVNTNSYDTVVDHCHKHMMNEKESRKKCESCDLLFTINDLKKHLELHSSNSKLAKSDFALIKFDYRRLLNSKWMGSIDLTEDKLQQIISKSIYKYTRGVKMSVVTDGDPDNTVYVCSECTCSVRPEKVYDHTLNPCKKDTIQRCGQCNHTFSEEDFFLDHIKTHSDKTQRIVKFTKDLKCKLNKAKSEINLLKCGVCNFGFHSIRGFGKHNCRSQGSVCTFCNVKFSKLVPHMDVHAEYSLISYEELMPTSSLKEDISNASVEKTCILYKCTCGLHFITEASVERHLSRCGPRLRLSTENCSKCGYLFPTDVLVSHLCSHHSKDVSVSFDIRLVRPKRKISKISTYKCGTCTVLFYEKGAAVKHNAACSKENYEGVECDICDLVFHASAIQSHERKHEENTKLLTEDDHEITVINEETKVTRTETSVKIKNIEIDDAERTIYRCKQCQLCYLNTKSLDYHFTNNHAAQVSTCGKCGLLFSERSQNTHIHKHHDRMKLDLSRLIVVDVESKIPKLNIVIERRKNNTLFQCNKCGLNYLTYQYLNTHIDSDCSGLAELCTDCGLMFGAPHILMHRQIHHDKYQYSKKDFDFRIAVWPPNPETNISADSENTSENSQNTNETLEESALIENADKKQTVSRSEIHAKETESLCISKPEDVNMTDVDLDKKGKQDKPDDSKNDIATELDTTNISISNETQSTFNTVYKCTECNVYFVSEITCYKHTNDHIPLEPAEFIDCKICSLSFKIHVLIKHMSKHHPKGAVLKEIFVKEYEPFVNRNGKEYVLALDKVQSTQVTTTADDGVSSTNLETKDELNDMAKPVNENCEDAMEVESQDLSNDSQDSRPLIVIGTVQESSPKNDLTCRFCEKKFSSPRAKEFHESLDHLDGIKPCPICKNEYNSSILNELHLSMKNDTFVCCQCSDRVDVNGMVKHCLKHEQSNFDKPSLDQGSTH